MADPQESVYTEFLNFDWDSSTDFQNGIAEILDGHLELLKEQDPHVTQIPAADKQQLIDQVKLFYFCSQTGHILNLEDFYVWKHNGGGKITLLPDSEEKASHVKIAEEPLEKAVVPEDNVTAETEETPYSSNYQQLVELIVSGKGVPGIKQIPDTVLKGQESKLEAKSRAKPWEKVNLEKEEVYEAFQPEEIE